MPVPPSGADCDSRADDNMADGALVGALSKRKSRGLTAIDGLGTETSDDIVVTFWP